MAPRKAPHMNAAQRKAIINYMRVVCDALELRDWTPFLEWTPADDDRNEKGEVAWADVTCVYGRKHIHVRFAEQFVALGATPQGVERQQHIIVHEIAHAVLGPLQDHVRLHLPKHLGQQGYDLFYDAFYQHLEYAVDQIATIAKKNLRLPEIPV